MSDQHEESAFHETINEDPLNPTPRLVYADWLDENGHHEAAEDHRWVGNQLSKWHEHEGEPQLEEVIPSNSSWGGHWLRDYPTERNPFGTDAIRHRVLSLYDGDDSPPLNTPSRSVRIGRKESIHEFKDRSILHNTPDGWSHAYGLYENEHELLSDLADQEIESMVRRDSWNNEELARFLIDRGFIDYTEDD